MTIVGHGNDFWGGTAEQGEFVYTTVPTAQPFDVAVHIASLNTTNSDGWSKSGIMARADASNNNVPTIFNAETSGNGISYERTDLQQLVNYSSLAPGWLRLTYDGSGDFTGYYYNGTSATVPASVDPNWMAITSYTQTMPGTTFDLGISDTAHNNACTNTSIFDNLGTLLPLVPVVAVPNVLPTTTPLSIAGGAKLDLSAGNQQIVSLSDYVPGSGGSIINSTSGSTSVLTLSPTGGSTTFSGSIQGGGTLGTISLVMNGSGTQVLCGSNTYTGTTTINSGTLQLLASGSLGNTAISVANGATFAPMPGNGTIVAGSSGNGSAGATLNLNAGAVFDMTDGGIGTFSLNQQSGFTGAALTLGGATLKFDLGSGGADSLQVSNGAAAVSGVNTISITGLGSGLTPGGTYAIISASSGLNGTFVFPNNSTSEALTVGGTPYKLTLNSSGTAETVHVYGPTSYQLVATAANPIIIQGGSTTVTSTIQNTGTQANNVPLDYTGLSVSLAGKREPYRPLAVRLGNKPGEQRFRRLHVYQQRAGHGNPYAHCGLGH